MKKNNMSASEKLAKARMHEKVIRIAKTRTYMGVRIVEIRKAHVPKWSQVAAMFVGDKLLGKSNNGLVCRVHHFIAPTTIVDHVGALHAYFVQSRIPFLLRFAMQSILLCLTPVFFIIFLLEFVPYWLMFPLVLWPLQRLQELFVNCGLRFYESERPGIKTIGLVVRKWFRVIENSQWDEHGKVGRVRKNHEKKGV